LVSPRARSSVGDSEITSVQKTIDRASLEVSRRFTAFPCAARLKGMNTTVLAVTSADTSRVTRTRPSSGTQERRKAPPPVPVASRPRVLPPLSASGMFERSKRPLMSYRVTVNDKPGSAVKKSRLPPLSAIASAPAPGRGMLIASRSVPPPSLTRVSPYSKRFVTQRT
jgi:hypothetical protein